MRISFALERKAKRSNKQGIVSEVASGKENVVSSLGSCEVVSGGEGVTAQTNVNKPDLSKLVLRRYHRRGSDRDVT